MVYSLTIGFRQVVAQSQTMDSTAVEYRIPLSSLGTQQDMSFIVGQGYKEKILSQRIDGFAGVYMDKVPGTFVVVIGSRVQKTLLNAAKRSEIAQIVREVYSLDKVNTFDVGRRQTIEVRPDQKIIVLRISKYDYRQLSLYRSIIEKKISQSSIGSIGIDVKLNKVLIFGQNDTNLGMLKAQISRLGIPADAFEIPGTAETTID